MSFFSQPRYQGAEEANECEATELFWKEILVKPEGLDECSVPSCNVRPKLKVDVSTQEALLGDLLQPHVTNPSNMKVLSSDVPPQKGFSWSLMSEKKDYGASEVQWIGWELDIPSDKYVRMSCWIKFLGHVPPVSGDFGFQIRGSTHNDWVRHLQPDAWTFVSAIGNPDDVNIDDDPFTLTFSSIHEPFTVKFAGLKIEIDDLPQLELIEDLTSVVLDF
eukprot:TRINITY_DN19961_c0_g1_i1.p1 TRINITY_DN19961_c0_g1~~TRINITY_DN19961_c0_g1_i1.p1  ORF type:complete len:248 (-),score=43.55 TRINITY_DN19961_c0_g1_i1:247-903(-)